jgi:hypothetical protein
MASIEMIKNKIAAAADILDAAEMRFNDADYESLKAERERTEADTQRAEAYQVYYNLNIELQTAEAEAAAAAAEAAVAAFKRPVGTKYKWTHKNIPDTYCVAIQTKQGVLQVKSVVRGVPELHEDECGCGPCWEFENNAPWRPKKPLKQKLFADLAAWDDTLPMNQGKLVITSAPITDKALKALCMKPLEATWESGQLEELQKRFPEGVFVLSSPSTGKQIEIKAHGMAIYCLNPNMVCCTFKQFFNDEKVQLMVEWRGMYIDLSHLF